MNKSEKQAFVKAMNWLHSGDVVLVPHTLGLDLAFIEVYTE